MNRLILATLESYRKFRTWRFNFWAGFLRPLFEEIGPRKSRPKSGDAKEEIFITFQRNQYIHTFIRLLSNPAVYIKLFLFFLSFHFTGKLCLKATDGFSASLLTSKKCLAYPTCGSEEEARALLNQPFHYLGSGGQSFAFASTDGKYVLKFFNNHPKPWVPLPKYQAKKKQKLRKAFSGYNLAFEKIRQESGLIFLHLNKTDFKAPLVTFFDKLNIVHKLDLNRFEFVLQRKAEPTYEYMKKNPLKGVNAIKELAVLLCERNIHDHDPRLQRNTGFIDGKAILIDPGSCTIAYGREPKFPAKFRKWLSENFPEVE